MRSRAYPRVRNPSVASERDGRGRCPVLKRRADQAAKASGGTPDGYTSITCTRALTRVHARSPACIVSLLWKGECQRGLIPNTNLPLTD